MDDKYLILIIAVIVVGIPIGVLVWGFCGFPVGFAEDKTIMISSADLTYMSKYAGLSSHGDCTLTDTNGESYHLTQDISSKYWCVSGWNRTEEIHAGQKYKVSLQQSLFGEMKNIVSIQRIYEIGGA